MKVMPFLWVVVLGLFVIPHNTFSYTYYVSGSADTTIADGSFAKPFGTVQKAANRMGAGDSCIIRGGIYREMVVPKASGTSAKPTVFTAYQNEDVFISGAEKITGWTLDAGKVYKASMNWDMGIGRNQIFVSSVMMYEARIPNIDAERLKPDDAYFVRNAPTTYVPASMINPGLYNMGSEKGAGVLKIWVGTPEAGYGKMKMPPFFDSCRLANAPQDFMAGAIVHKSGTYWASEYGYAALGWGIEPSTAPVNAGWMYIKVNAPNWEAGGGYFAFIGKRIFLDAQKEWIVENGNVYFRPPEDKNPNTLLIEAKKRDLCMDLSGLSYIVVQGVNFTSGSINLNGSNNCIINDCHAQYITHWTFPPNFTTDREAGRSAIFVKGNNNKITNSSVEYSAATGIYILGVGNLVENCIIHDCDYIGTYEVGIASGSKDPGINTVTKCTMYNFGRSALTISTQAANSIMTTPQKWTYNEMYNCMFLVEDGGTIYTAGESGGGTEIAYNWMYNMIRPWNAHHVYFDFSGGYHFRVHHNVFWQEQTWMAENNSITSVPMRNMVYNNTSIDSIRSELYKIFDDDERGANALWANGKPAVVGIKDAKNKDFSLLSTSSAIDKGTFRADSQYLHLIDFPSYRAECYLLDTPVVIPQAEITGSKPDLGAYEFGKPRWIPGHTWGSVTWNYPSDDVAISQHVAQKKIAIIPKCIISKSGLTVSLSSNAGFSVNVMDISGRIVASAIAVPGQKNVQISSQILPSRILLARVLVHGETQTFTLNAVH